MNKILVVEDEKDIRDQICDLLESAGYEVTSVPDGKHAISFFEHEIPDLVISDIMMPNIDGYQLLNYFQKLPAASTIPFIFLSAKVDYNDIRHGMNCGANDYLTKPFRAKELLQSVETQLKKKEKSDKKFEEIYMDISSYVPHELRTPLIPILGYIELIQEGINELSKEEISDMTDKIKHSVHRLHKVVEKFIKYSEIRIRLENRNNNQQPIECFISSPASIIEIISKRKMGEYNRHSDLELNLADIELKILETDFEFIIEELVSNAQKFSNAGTKVIIKSEIKDNMYNIEITDHGRGMTPEQLTNIHPFIQHERKKIQQQGNGLGLVTIKKLAEYYEGSFQIESVKNVFTTCKVMLPVVLHH